MGTRSTVKFIEVYTDRKTNKRVEQPICAMYVQYDGYMSGMGLEIGEYLEDMTMVNGLSGYDGRVANGMGCLAAQFIQYIKDGAGGHYMTNLDDSQEYNYEIIGGFDENMGVLQPIIRVTAYGEKIFEGTAQELINYKEEE